MPAAKSCPASAGRGLKIKDLTPVSSRVADNNLHVLVSVGPASGAQAEEVDERVYRGVLARRGSISAEHGIGLDKRHAMHAAKPPAVLALMRQLKAMLDPQGLLNPGKVV